MLFYTFHNYFLIFYIYLCNTVFISFYPIPLSCGTYVYAKNEQSPTKKEITLKYGYLLLQHFLQESSNASYSMRATISFWYLSYVVFVSSPD